MALRESGLLAPEESETEPAADGGTPEPADEEPAEPAESEADEALATEAIDDAASTSDAEDAGGDEEDNEEDEDEEVEAAAPPKPQNPYELPGDWYVIHSYSGYENKVKVNLQTRISTMHMDTAIFDVVIPMEDVVEIKGGKKVTVPKKVLPGYLLVRMYMDDDAWFTVRNTPGVTGFVGHGTKPSPLTRREVERFLGTPEEAGEETKAAPRFKPAWDVGESVRVVEGPFADFNGVIEDINLDQSKVRVLVNIFDRETPVELTFEQIVKI
ncbi:MAG: transcription termination/antitermination protein NusG [Acidimicrobiia bacterium]|nr:transcription termination/antitermination protein NusG [Acidimicrobiia bacterium]